MTYLLTLLLAIAAGLCTRAYLLVYRRNKTIAGLRRFLEAERLINRQSARRLPLKWEDEYDEPSEEFQRAVTTGGTVWVTCELCGRENVSSQDLGFLETEEIERIEALDREGKISWHDYSLSVAWLFGYQVVVECPCNRLRAIEDIAWNARWYLGPYYRQRALREIDSARSDALLNHLVPVEEMETVDG